MGEVKKYEGDRKISFLDKDVARWLREEAAESGALEDGLCLKRFHADFEAEGVCGWKAGDVVTVDGEGSGGRKYIITMTGKRCFPECVLLQKTGQKCLLASGVAFGCPAEAEEE